MDIEQLKQNLKSYYGTISLTNPQITSPFNPLQEQMDSYGAAHPELTPTQLKAAQYAASYAVDPFENLPVVFNNTIAAFSAATTGVAYAIVGDLGEGALANFPNGEEITIKFDDMSLAEKDLVKIVGRQYVGLGVVAPDAFVKITK